MPTRRRGHRGAPTPGGQLLCYKTIALPWIIELSIFSCGGACVLGPLTGSDGVTETMGMGTMPPKRVIAKRPKRLFRHPFRRTRRRAVRNLPISLYVSDVWIPNIPPVAVHGNPHKDQFTPQPPMSIEDALDNFYEVKEGLKDADKEKYMEFLQLVRDFRASSLWDRTLRLMRSVLDLFQGYTHLILGLNKFLPDAYQFLLCADDSVLIAVDVSDT